MARKRTTSAEPRSWADRIKNWPPIVLIGLVIAALGAVAGAIDSAETIKKYVADLRKPADLSPTAIADPALAKVISDDILSPVEILNRRALDLDGNGSMDAIRVRYQLEADASGMRPTFTDLYAYREGAYRNLLHDSSERELAVTHGGGGTQIVTWSHEGSGGFLTLEAYSLDDTGLVTPINLDAIVPPGTEGFESWLETLGLHHATPSVGRNRVVVTGGSKSLSIQFTGAEAKASVTNPSRGQVGQGVYLLKIDDAAATGNAPPSVTINGNPVELEPIASDATGFRSYQSVESYFLGRGEKVELAELANSGRWTMTDFTETSPLVPNGPTPVIDITINWYLEPVRLVIRFRT